MSGNTILVSRARRFLVTWSGNEGLATGRLQIKPSGSGDENAGIPDNRRHSTAGISQYVIHSGGNKFSNVRSFIVQFDWERA